MDGIKLSTEREHDNNFWNSTITCGNVQHHFLERVKESDNFARIKESLIAKNNSMSNNALHLPLDGHRIHVNRDVEVDILDVVKDC